jgi:hypothetical protein
MIQIVSSQHAETQSLTLRVTIDVQRRSNDTLPRGWSLQMPICQSIAISASTEAVVGRWLRTLRGTGRRLVSLPLHFCIPL